MRDSLERSAPLFAMFGALAGAGFSLLVFGALRWQPYSSIPWSQFLFPMYVAPIVPAAAAFVACTCVHPAPRGWPFVRGGAAAAAYLTFSSAGLGGYNLLGVYSAYAAAADIIAWVIGPVALTATTTFVIAFLAHHRVFRESALDDVPPRRSFARKVSAYHILAAAYGVLSIPQAVAMASRAGPYILFFLPLPVFLFSLGTSEWFWAALTRDSGKSKRDIFRALVLQSLSLFLMELFAVDVLLYSVLPGRYTWRDPYYQNVITDPTLALTPFLGFAVLAVLVYMLATEWGGPAFTKLTPNTTA